MGPGYGTFAAVVRTFRRDMAMMRKCNRGYDRALSVSGEWLAPLSWGNPNCYDSH